MRHLSERRSSVYSPAIAGVLCCVLVLPCALRGQQVADTAFRPPIAQPTHRQGEGPLVLIDEGHNNFHTESGRYLPFANLLRRDGYVVAPLAGQFTSEALEDAKVLVIANSQHWPERSAFSQEEIDLVREWVGAGGSLFLIGDHPPFSEGAAQLGMEFGIRFREAAARDATMETGRLVFRRSDGTLANHPGTVGIDSVVTFTGSSFTLESEGEPLLVFGPGVYSFREQNDPNPEPLDGQLQGALVRYRRGRVAAFAEAAMFSAQLAGPEATPMGMNAPAAGQNYQFLLNVIHWLTEAVQPSAGK